MNIGFINTLHDRGRFTRTITELFSSILFILWIKAAPGSIVIGAHDLVAIYRQHVQLIDRVLAVIGGCGCDVLWMFIM